MVTELQDDLHGCEVLHEFAMSSCCQTVGLTAGGLDRPSIAHGKDKHTKLKKLGTAVLWLLSFSGQHTPNVPCITTGQENDLI